MLQRQLQAEKQANNLCTQCNTTIGSSAPNKDRDQDDEEDIPLRQTVRNPYTQPPPTTTNVFAMPSRFKPPASYTAARNAPAKKQPVSQGARESSSIGSNVLAMRPKFTQAPVATPKKRKAGDLTQRPLKKERQRSKQEEIDEDALDLGPLEEPATPRKKQCRSFAELDESLDFDFKAVMSWHADGGIDEHLDSKEDLSDVCSELWDSIAQVKDRWEEKKGPYWQDDFAHKSYNYKSTPCVTKKIGRGRVQWRPGCEGKFACKDCVAANQPCFTWDASLQEFLLLPLHEEDRRMEVKEGFEIRTWLNL